MKTKTLKQQILELSGLTEDKFYKTYDTEEKFMAKYGKQLKKAENGNNILGMSSGKSPDFGNIIGKAGPWGALISKVSGAGDQIGQTIGGDVGSFTSGMFKPEKALGLLKRNDISIFKKFIGTAIPGLGNMFLNRSNPEERQRKELKDLAMEAGEDIQQPEREYIRPEDNVNSGGMFSPYGTGTNILGKNGLSIKGNPTEIQNTYDPNTVYTDGGYEPLNDSGIKQYNSYMENGGWMNPEYNPKTIVKFNELRTGGNLRQNNMFPQQYALGGEIQTHRGGVAKDVSYNPYSPGSGNTAEFFGKDHSHGGIDTTYSHPNNLVNVEDKEFVTEVKDGGNLNPNGENNNSAVVFGNLILSKNNANMIGTPEYANKKFKKIMENYIVPGEQKQNKILAKSAELAETSGNSVFDKLKLATAQAMTIGAKEKLKKFQSDKDILAKTQQAINDTSEEYNLVPEYVARGEIKQAKKGITLKAEGGEVVTKNQSPYTWPYPTTLPIPVSNTYVRPGVDINPMYEDPSYDPAWATNSQKKTNMYDTNNFNIQFNEDSWATDIVPPPEKGVIKIKEPLTRTEKMTIADQLQQEKKKVDNYGNSEYEYVEANKRNPYLDIGNRLLSYFKPPYPLSKPDLSAEYLAMSLNQQEPVQGFQKFSPQLVTPYSISLNDRVNSIISAYAPAEKSARNNPALLSLIAADKSNKINEIAGEQFRLNQQQQMGIYNQNINTLNQAQLSNLGIFKELAEKQSIAKSNTKRDTLDIANAISNKLSQYKTEKAISDMKSRNESGYYIDEQGRVIDMNGIPQFNIPTVGTQQAETIPGTIMGANGQPMYSQYGANNELTYKPISKAILNTPLLRPSKKKGEKRNGGIVAAMKNL